MLDGLWVKNREGSGDQWVKSGDWELGDHVIELLFRFQIDMDDDPYAIVLKVK